MPCPAASLLLGIGPLPSSPFLSAVIEAASSIKNTHKCVERLAGCIFVQNVETPALAVMMPVLTRGLNDKSEEIRRTCCQIVDNMCKVVEIWKSHWNARHRMNICRSVNLGV